MNDTNVDPEDPRLRELLRSARPTTALPPRFQENVWRRIEQLELADGETSSFNFLTRLALLVLQPRLAAAFAVTMLVLGGGIGAVQGTAVARQDSHQRYLAAVAPGPVR